MNEPMTLKEARDLCDAWGDVPMSDVHMPSLYLRRVRDAIDAHLAKLSMVPDGRADALKLIAAASESYEVPAHLTPSKAEYVKAGARSFIKHLNATLAADPSQPEDAA